MFEVPKSKASIKQNRFEFRIDGQSHSVPLIKFLPVRIVERMDSNGLAGILEAFDPATREVLRDLASDQFEALSDAWAAASEVDVGESSASGG